LRVLIAEDDSFSRRVLEVTLGKWGHEIVIAHDGSEAWMELQKPDAPSLLILDWMMPGMDGTEICRKLRAVHDTSVKHVYIILLTAKSSTEDIVAGLEAGADDYLTKPFDRAELRARLQAGIRIVELQRNLTARVAELEEALANIKQLQGMLPICSYCKKIRDDQNYWQQIEHYVMEHSEALFSHSICPDCYGTIVQPQIDKRLKK